MDVLLFPGTSLAVRQWELSVFNEVMRGDLSPLIQIHLGEAAFGCTAPEQESGGHSVIISE